MLRLETLGTLDIRDGDGRSRDGLLRQPKSVALLVFLAVARPIGFQRRDTLVGLFWPDVDQDRARRALNQLVHRLRRELGADVIESRGDNELAAGSGITCDASEFRRALEQGQTARALDLYKGEFLPGFYLPATEAFERWIEEERTELTRLAHAGASLLADQAASTVNLEDAVRWARHALAIAPFDEAGVRRLLRLHVATGNRAAALHAYDSFARLLKREFAVEPAPDTQALVDSVRAESGPVGVQESLPIVHPAAAAVNPAVLVPSGSNPVRTVRKRRLWIVGAMLTVVLLGGTLALWSPRPKAADTGSIRRVAVLYFDNSRADPEVQFLADALTESIIDQLSGYQALEVVSRNGVLPYRGRAVPPDSIERALHPRFVISGSVLRANERVLVTVQLADARTGIVRDSRMIEQPMTELLALTHEVNQNALRFVRQAIGREIRLSEWRADTRSETAWRTLQAAQVSRKSSGRLRQLGDAAAAQRALLESDSLARVAAKHDRRWAEPDVLQAWNAESQMWIAFAGGSGSAAREWIERGLAAADRAVRRNPAYAPAYEVRGVLRYRFWQLGLANSRSDAVRDSAERDLRSAVHLEPGNATAWAALSGILETREQRLEAKVAAENAFENDGFLEDANDVLNRLFTTSFELKEEQDARRWCAELRHRLWPGWVPAYCALLLEAFGDQPQLTSAGLVLLADSALAAEPSQTAQRMRPRFNLLIATALHRRNEHLRARALTDSVLRSRSPDPELLRLEAALRLLTRDTARAQSLLDQYVKSLPPNSRHIRSSRIFHGLRTNVPASGGAH